MATQKKSKKQGKKATDWKNVEKPFDFYTKGRSRDAILLDYSIKAKEPSSEEHRVNRSDYKNENEAYISYFKKHNLTPSKKQTTTTTKPATAKKTTAAKKTAAKKTTAAKTTAAKKTASKKNDIKVTNKTSNSKK